MNHPYVKSGSDVQPQKIQRHTPEYVRFKFYDADGALIDCDSTPTVTIKDAGGTVLVDFGTTSLSDVNLTNESTGVYYYAVDTKTDADLDWIFAYPKGVIDSETVTLDQGVPIRVVAEEAVSDEDNFCEVADVEAKCGGRSFQQDTTPSASRVQVIIDGLSQDILAYLKVSYASIADADDLTRLRNIVSSGAAAQAELECPRPNYERSDRYQRQFDQAMKEIKKGDMPLSSTGTGAEAVTTLTGMVAGLGTDTSIADDDKGPIFSRDDEW